MYIEDNEKGTLFMIIVHMMGNLGNQMFIYAMAKKLQMEYNEEVIFDLSGLKRYYYTADYKMDQFNIEGNFSYDLKKIGFIHRFKYWLASKIFHVEQYVFAKLRKDSQTPDFITNSWLRRGCIFYTNRLFKDFPKIKRKYKYVYGYFQSDKYFDECSEQLMKELTLKGSLSEEELKIAKEMESGNAVGVSIRANKAPENPKVKDNVLMGFISKDYYYEGMKRIAEQVSNPKFYVFADDINEVEQNYKLPFPVTYVRPTSAVNGVVLLSKCKHFVIANSTFSWWGAYLSGNKDKKIIMPTPWDRVGTYRESIYFDKAEKIECQFED